MSGIRCRRAWGWALALLVAVSAPAAAQDAETAGEPWLLPAFTAGAGDLLAAARRVPAPAGADVVVLYQDVGYSFDRQSRVTWRRRWVYRILARSALDRWSVSEVRWSPWFQERPEVRLRVITADGSVQRPDDNALTEVPESADAGEVDPAAGRRILRAPLPGIEVGAVVEEEVVVRDARPFFAAGTSGRAYVVLPAPIHRGRLTLEAPTDLPLRYGVRGAALEPERRVEDGRVRLVFSYRASPAAGTPAAGLPAAATRHPHVAFSTGESWRAAAAAYARLAASRIGGSDAAGLLDRLSPTARTADRAETQTERIAELLAALRARVTASPLELGARDIAPAEPRATVERGTGDAKDTAALLAALLRAEGIPAYLALVRAGYDQDVEAGLPGLGLFNHALVYVPAGRSLWIDPADRFSRAGELPANLEGRQVLIASATTRALVRTPESRSEDHRTVARIRVHLAADGPARIVEVNEYHGQPERYQRRLAASLDAESRRRGYVDYLRSAYRARELGEVEETDAADLGVPYRLRLEARGASRGFTSGDEAAVALDPRTLLTALPEEFLIASPTPRQAGYSFRLPFVNEQQVWIYPPRGMRLRSLPVDRTQKLGTGLLECRFEVEGEVAYARLRFDSGPRHLTAEQLDDYRRAVQELLAEEALVLWFDRVGR